MRESEVAKKDPDADLDWMWDWSKWLKDGDTIAEATVIPVEPTTVTVHSIQKNDTNVVAWLSDGALSENAEVCCHIETVQGRKDDRTLKVNVRKR